MHRQVEGSTLFVGEAKGAEEAEQCQCQWKDPLGSWVAHTSCIFVSSDGESVQQPRKVLPTFPTMYNSNSGKIRLGECILWIVESLRLGMPASMGCNMVESNAANYEAIYFLSDEEVLDVAARYKHWWENRKYPRTAWTIDPCFDNPLCGSGYRWW